jgi:hypothetical protein
MNMKGETEVHGTAYAAAFFGVAFLGVAFFGVAAFFAAVFLGAAFLVAFGAAGAVVLVIRPDFVLPRTRWTSSSTAGAGAVLRGLLALALGFAAAATFFGAAFAAAVFFGAAFLAAAALVFYRRSQQQGDDDLITIHTVAAAFLGAAFFSTIFFSGFGSAFLAAGAAPAGFASFTVPEAPGSTLALFIECAETRRPMRAVVVATKLQRQEGADIPLGREKSPFSSPEVMARLTWPLNAVSDRLPSLLFALMYFWIAWRLLGTGQREALETKAWRAIRRATLLEYGKTNLDPLRSLSYRDIEHVSEHIPGGFGALARVVVLPAHVGG